MPKKIPPLVKAVRESKLKQSKKNKHVSYSQLTNFASCQRKWYLTYVRNLAPYQASIHATFGTSMHEVIQTWLSTMYDTTVKAANELDLDAMLYERLLANYKIQKRLNSHQHFSDSNELQMFYLDGKHILDYLKKKRGAYFGTKGIFLAGVETLLYQELRPGVMFKGYIDLVFYDSRVDRWKLVDIKTSTSGWNKFAKSDDTKTAQLLLYKEFFAKQFNIDVEKIDVEYFIVKRKVPVEADFAVMQRRVQEFAPASGKIKRGKAISLMNTFTEEAIDIQGNFVEKEYPTNASKNSCRFCIFKGNPICPDAVL